MHECRLLSVHIPVVAVPESNGGLYLTRRGDFNVASHINTFFRVHCKPSAPLGASADVKALMADKRQVTFFGKTALAECACNHAPLFSSDTGRGNRIPPSHP